MRERAKERGRGSGNCFILYVFKIVNYREVGEAYNISLDYEKTNAAAGTTSRVNQGFPTNQITP